MIESLLNAFGLTYPLSTLVEVGLIVFAVREVAEIVERYRE